MKLEPRKEGGGADHASARRSRHAVFRRMARRSGDGAEQSNQIMSGVCGHWVKSSSMSSRLGNSINDSTINKTLNTSKKCKPPNTDYSKIIKRRLRIKSTKIKFLEEMKNTENNHLFIFLAAPKKGSGLNVN